MNKYQGNLLSGVALGSFFAFLLEGIAGRFVFSSLFRQAKNQNKTVRQANRYFPVQSPSERVAGHPIVGVS